jgi:hypothetical protein
MGFLFSGVLLVGDSSPQEDDCVNDLPQIGRLAQLLLLSSSWNKNNDLTGT